MSGYPINDEILLALDIDRAADLARRAEKREARKVRKAELKARRGTAMATKFCDRVNAQSKVGNAAKMPYEETKGEAK